MDTKKREDKRVADRKKEDRDGKGKEKSRKERSPAWHAGRILVPVLGVVLGIAICVGIGIWNDYRDAIIDTQKQQMLLTVQSLGESMKVFIREYEEDLDGLYQMSQGGQDENNILQEYVDTHETFVDDVIVENEAGEILKSTKNTKIQQIYSVSRIDEQKSLRLAKTDSGRMCLVLRMEIPGEGAFSVVLNLEQYYQALVRGLKVGSNGYMVLKDANGIILMHPEQAQWGIEVIDGRMEMYEDLNLDLESLREMTDHQKEGREGVDEYYSYWWLKEGYPRVRKISAYCPVRIGEDFLVLSAVMDYDDIYIPVARGVLRLVALFLAFFLIMVAMAWYIGRMFLQRQKDTEQIAYLTELNRLLEEMHRSEETIAHQQRLQIMGTMTGGIAHEFNNLLTPIMGYADLLLMELDENSEQYESAMEIYEASEKAKEIIQQISSLSRKNMETAYKNMNGKRMLARALKMVRSVCPANICLTEDIGLNDECILCNETQMNQVILNICVNAIHAIHHQDGSICVRAWVAEREELDGLEFAGHYLPLASKNWNHYIGIEIRDNGCGMSKEVMNQIFDPFFTTKKGGKGTGLGLALVEQIVSSHKGGISVESEPGKGSAFFLYLPVNEQGDGSIRPVSLRGEERDGEAEAKSGERLRLLIVDDNPKVLRLLEKDAAKLKISLVCRMNFEEARRALEEQENFDALVTEQEIGGQSGVDFSMSLQGKYPDMARIVMADQMTRELVEARQRRFLDACIDKPVSISSILEALKRNLNDL